ncbi:MAG TPA: hypothetical protein VFF89_01625 [Sphingobium sp.]|nr:hypothetical protein [Sphingobium sp.]
MDKQTENYCRKKHGCPSNSQIIFHCGLILLISILGGIAYGFTIMEVPTELSASDLTRWKLAFGFGWGLVAALVATILYIPWIIYKRIKFAHCVATGGAE